MHGSLRQLVEHHLDKIDFHIQDFDRGCNNLQRWYQHLVDCFKDIRIAVVPHDSVFLSTTLTMWKAEDGRSHKECSERGEHTDYSQTQNKMIPPERENA